MVTRNTIPIGMTQTNFEDRIGATRPRKRDGIFVEDDIHGFGYSLDHEIRITRILCECQYLFLNRLDLEKGFDLSTERIGIVDAKGELELARIMCILEDEGDMVLAFILLQ